MTYRTFLYRLTMTFFTITVLLLLNTFLTEACAASNAELVPVIDGPHWQITTNPDLGELNSSGQQTVDFAIWQAADKTWQLWACLRNTKCGGNTRLFYAWEAKRLTDTNWKPRGIMMQADKDLGETEGGLQAPHVFRKEGRYYMVYGDWVNICMAESEDGKNFKRIIRPDGTTGMFAESEATWDPMILKVGDWYHCYYTARPATHGLPLPKGAVYCRRSKDLKRWSSSTVVSAGGVAGWSAYSAQCPFVLRYPQNDHYYLFRTGSTGSNHRTFVYSSTDPLYFGIDDNRPLLYELPVAAPEIILDDGQYYIASMRTEYDGLRIAKLKWVTLKERQKIRFLGYRGVFNFDNKTSHQQWRMVKGNLAPIFTTSARKYFDSRYVYFIGTAENAQHNLDDSRTGIIESPTFTLKSPKCSILISGGQDREKTYVAICEVDADGKLGKELVRFTGSNSNNFQEFPLDAEKFLNRPLRIRVVDQSKTKWGHINFGGLFEYLSE